tara:strand:- start:298 stop:501 length:204 start_codon:yes stop_codon:yes gene_type:complete
MNNEENNNKPSAVDDAADIMSKYTDQPEDNPSDIDRDYEELTKEEKAEADYKKRLEELRKRDPFVYR